MENTSKEEAMGRFLRNPYWKGLYDNAPGNAKKFYEYKFQMSGGAIPASEREGIVVPIYESMTAEEWDYVISHTDNKMGRWGLQQARMKYGKN